MPSTDTILRVTASALGALFFTTITIAAAAGPARAVETTPVVYAQAAAVTQANG